jgi:UDP-glucuronate 4-epimerase
MAHVLVTGGAGFLGSHLVDSLLRDGWRVTVVDNFDPFYDPVVKHARLDAHRHNPRFSLVETDLRHLPALRASLAGGYDVIVHLAARAGVRPSIAEPLVYSDVNIRGTLHLLELAKAWETPQFVFASSSSVYGVNPVVPWREDSATLMPISPYAATKVAGELLGHTYSHLTGMRFLALRFFTIYGPRQRPDLAIHDFARRMLAGRTITLFGDGSTRRDYTYVADIVSGIHAAMTYTETPYEVINLGNDTPVTLAEMVDTLADALHVTPRIHRAPEQPGDVPQTWADIGKARRLLGYAPQVPFPDGIRRFAEWMEGQASLADAG